MIKMSDLYSKTPFFISFPHSGEEVPEEAVWLKGLPEEVLMCDVDRYVDELYEPVVQALGLVSVRTQWHRYAADLNRLPTDVDEDSVKGSGNPPGTHTTGLHWVKTTTGIPLMKTSVSLEVHKKIVEKYHLPFHEEVEATFQAFKGCGHKKVYHLDAHSMPSRGTSAHRDKGADRPQVVVSDVDGTSCEKHFTELVIESYKNAGFEVGYNWPYKGGRVTQTYGKPGLGQNTLQVELNRAMYLNETSKHKNNDLFSGVQDMLLKAVTAIYNEMGHRT